MQQQICAGAACIAPEAVTQQADAQGVSGGGYTRPVSARTAEALAAAKGAPAPNLAISPAFWAGRASAGAALGGGTGGPPAEPNVASLGPAHGAPLLLKVEEGCLRAVCAAPGGALTELNPAAVPAAAPAEGSAGYTAGGGPPTPAQAPVGLPSAPGSGQSALSAPGSSPEDQEPAAAAPNLAMSGAVPTLPLPCASAAPAPTGQLPRMSTAAGESPAAVLPFGGDGAAAMALLAPLVAMAQARSAAAGQNSVVDPDPAAARSSPGSSAPEWRPAWLAAARAPPVLGPVAGQLTGGCSAGAPAMPGAAPAAVLSQSLGQGEGQGPGQGQGQGRGQGQALPPVWHANGAAGQLLASLPMPVLQALAAQLGAGSLQTGVGLRGGALLGGALAGLRGQVSAAGGGPAGAPGHLCIRPATCGDGGRAVLNPNAGSCSAGIAAVPPAAGALDLIPVSRMAGCAAGQSTASASTQDPASCLTGFAGLGTGLAGLPAAQPAAAASSPEVAASEHGPGWTPELASVNPASCPVGYSAGQPAAAGAPTGAASEHELGSALPCVREPPAGGPPLEGTLAGADSYPPQCFVAVSGWPGLLGAQLCNGVSSSGGLGPHSAQPGGVSPPDGSSGPRGGHIGGSGAPGDHMTAAAGGVLGPRVGFDTLNCGRTHGRAAPPDGCTQSAAEAGCRVGRGWDPTTQSSAELGPGGACAPAAMANRLPNGAPAAVHDLPGAAVAGEGAAASRSPTEGAWPVPAPGLMAVWQLGDRGLLYFMELLLKLKRCSCVFC